MKKYLFSLLAIALLLTPQFVYAEDVYDVILFWGQSNMVGSVGAKTCSNNEKEIKHVDENLTRLGEEAFSEQSGIHASIVAKYKTLGHVDVPVSANTVYDYSYLNNTLKAVTKNTNYVGESIYVSKSGSKLVFNNDTTKTSSLVRSRGTNMAVWYAKTHYAKTGHKVVIVMAAHGGKKIQTFLPHDNNADSDSLTSTSDNCYLYEGMKTVYQAAIKYMNDNNLKIGHKIDIVVQGEADVSAANTSGSTNWNKMYLNVHKKLKNELGIEFSAIVETATTNGSNKLKGVNLINKAQKKVINENDDIILGSNYPYKRYVPAKASYSGTFLGTTMSYETALARANLSTSDQCSNTIHFNSAALSQIGHETALRVANHIQEITPVALSLKSLKLNGNEISNPSLNSYSVTVENNTNKMNIEATLDDSRASFVNGYGPREVNLNVGENKFYLKVTDGTNTKSYEFNVTRKQEETTPISLTLKTLKLNGTAVSNPTLTSYNVTVESDVTKFKIEATLDDSRASFVNNYGPREVNLNVGENKIYLKVTDGTNTKNYEFNVTRKQEETPTTISLSLKTLKLNGTVMNNPILETYSITVENTITTFKIEATLEDSRASFVNGFGPREVNLNTGENKIELKVTDGQNNKTYEFTINRKPEETPTPISLTVKSFILNGVVINDPTINAYDVTVESVVDTFKIEATLDDSRATFVNGFGPREEKINYGENKVYLKITDGEKIETYEFTVYRKPAEAPTTDNPPTEGQEAIPIPDTATFVNKAISIISGILLLLGFGIFGYNNLKENRKKDL